jgi:glycerate kinase
VAGPGIRRVSRKGNRITADRPYTVLVAPDSFKGSLDAHAVALAINAGVREALPHARVILHPIADGGEGLLDVLLPVMGGNMREADVCGPLPGERVSAAWGYVEGEHLAILEMARAAGLGLVPEAKRDPRTTTTYGVGELIRAALDAGARSLVIGIGGSATNDGGAGMAQALGVRFLDPAGRPIAPGGAGLCDLERIDASSLDPRLKETTMVVACDVQNPLTGPEGATAVYAPQKGATPEMVVTLEQCLCRYRDVLRTQLGVDVQQIPGTGAAGGLGAGLVVFCRGRLQSGIDLVLDVTRFDEKLREADLVITGEGRVDAQTRHGKALSGLLRRTGAAGVPVLAVAGQVDGDRALLVAPGGFADIISLVDAGTSPQMAMANAASLVRQRVASMVGRFMRAS